jgi:1-acyl-sn-glycerol-3-phosphate acyltransferase
MNSYRRIITGMLYTMTRAFFRIVLKAVFALLGGVRVEGLENVPRRGPVLIAPNHLSHADPPLIGTILPRPIWYMATDELFAMPVLGRLARLLRAFPVRQDSPDRAALRRAEQLLKAGEALVIFPEGHESPDGALQPILPGSILLAMHGEAPVVPVGILGTDAMMPPCRFRLRRAKHPAVVRFGRPIPVEELTGGLKGRAALDHGVRHLTEALESLLEDMYRAEDRKSACCAAHRQA